MTEVGSEEKDDTNLITTPLTNFLHLFERMTRPVKYTTVLKRVLFIPKEIAPTGDDVYAYEYKDGYAFSLIDIAKYAGKTQHAAYQAFQRVLIKENEILGHSILVYGESYIDIEKEGIDLSLNLRVKSKRGRPEKILVLEEGVPILLAAMRGETKDALFFSYNKTFFKMLRTARKLKYVKHFILSADDPKLLTAPIENKKIAITGDLVDSRGEIIIAAILDSLGLGFQHGIYLFEERVNFDFYIKNSYPHKFIEYFGRDDRSYKAKREYKEKVIKKLEETGHIKFLILEPDEVENIPSLTDKIREFLGEN